MNINKFNNFLDTFDYKVSTDGKDKKIILPSDIKNVDGKTIKNPKYLESVIIPDGVSIDSCAFYGCSSLISITMPDSMGIGTIGDAAFYNCKSLTSITIPNSVISIGRYAFNGCSSLTSVTIFKNTTFIASNAFKECNKDLTFYAPKGSYAEEYAKQNNITFKADI